MTITGQPSKVARTHALRIILTEHLTRVLGSDQLPRVLPGLVQAIGPHLAPDHRPPARLAALTDREHEVLRLVARGRTAREIGESLGGLTANTIKTYLRNIYDKLNAEDRAHAVARGYDTGLLP